MDDVFNVIAEPENKLTIMATKEYASIYEKSRLRRGTMSMKFVEGLREEYVTFSVEHHSPYFEQVKDLVTVLVEAGICNLWLGISPFPSSRHLHFKRAEEELPALILTWEDLEIGILVCTIPLMLSFISFICEVAGPKIKIILIKTRDLLTFVFLIRAFADIKRMSK